jgi:hypothetical protein
MKNYNLKYIFPGLLLFLTLLQGCDDYLEENPDNRVELNSLTKAAQLLTTAYSDASYNFTEWLSDNVSYTIGTTKLPKHDEGYNWEDFSEFSQDTPEYFWNQTYYAIAHANEVLEVIDELPGDEALREAVRGEALLTRAYGHFMLVNLFGKHFNERTADDDPGVPYVEEPETEFIKTYTRNTVEEVYDLVERDMLAGLELVNDNLYANSGKYHFTRPAALAFASRFYLFKEEYAKCVQYSNELLGNSPEIYIKNIPNLLEQRINTDDYVRLYSSPNDRSNLLLIRIVSNFQIPSLGHWPDRDLYSSLFESNPYNSLDIRQDPAWVAGLNGLAATKYEFLFERSSLTSNVGLNYTISLAFRGEEVLLNRAESYLYLNQFDNALADLQVLANYRYPDGAQVTRENLRAYYGGAENQDQLRILINILEERQKEFIHEGLRWFDIKRYELPVTHVLEDLQTTITLEENDRRKVLQIPESAVEVGGLEPNRR